MSHVMVAPELMESAAANLATIGETLNAAHLTAAAPTVAVLPAAADEVSASIADLLSGYGQEYQKLAGEAAAFHEQFVQALKASANAYDNIEYWIARYLQFTLATEQGVVRTAVTDPTQLLNPATIATAAIPVLIPALLPILLPIVIAGGAFAVLFALFILSNGGIA